MCEVFPCASSVIFPKQTMVEKEKRKLFLASSLLACSLRHLPSFKTDPSDLLTHTNCRQSQRMSKIRNPGLLSDELFVTQNICIPAFGLKVYKAANKIFWSVMQKSKQQQYHTTDCIARTHCSSRRRPTGTQTHMNAKLRLPQGISEKKKCAAFAQLQKSRRGGRTTFHHCVLAKSSLSWVALQCNFVSGWGWKKAWRKKSKPEPYKKQLSVMLIKLSKVQRVIFEAKFTVNSHPQEHIKTILPGAEYFPS